MSEENREKIDLNLLCLAVQTPNPTLFLEGGRKLFIKLHSILFAEVETEPDLDGQNGEVVLLTLADGELLKLNHVESREFFEKVKVIATKVQAMMDMARRQQAQHAGRQLGILS